MVEKDDEKEGEQVGKDEKESEEIQKSEETEKTPAESAGANDKGPEEKTFITELSVNTNKSRVTIVTPKREDTRQGKSYTYSHFSSLFIEMFELVY